MNTRVFIAEKNAMSWRSVSSMLKNDSELTVIGESGDDNSIINQIGRLRPDIVILNVSPFETDGIGLMHEINVNYPFLKMITMSESLDSQFTIQTLKAGASGCLLQTCSTEDIVTAINSVMNNNIYLCNELRIAVIKGFTAQVPKTGLSASSVLTNRQKEVLRMVADGYSNKQIASEFRLSVKTIESHYQQINERLKIYNVAELTKFAIREGLTTV